MDEAGIYARESPVLDRVVQLGIASGRVISVSFPEAVPADADPEHPLLDRVFAYLDGEEDTFSDVEVAITVPTEQRQALEAARNVPYGETITVERLTTIAGLDADAEEDRLTVRTALQENPIPIFVPDHRIRDASGATPGEVAKTLRELES
jgi:methylated-DNA-[protein]-cysteine S-methyltransferase